MAHSSLVAALSPVMGQTAAAAMATAAMNKSPAGAAKRVSMDLGGPQRTSGTAATASTSSVPEDGPAAGASTAPSGAAETGAEARGAGDASEAGGSGNAFWSSAERPPGNNGSGGGGGGGDELDDQEADYEDDEFEDDGSSRRGLRGAMAGGGAAPSTALPGGKPTMRGKSQYRGVSWCEKVGEGRSENRGRDMSRL